VSCHLLEFDERYSARGDFSRYDYNAPGDVPPALHGAFDVVVADPPYLAEECFLKTSECAPASALRHTHKHARVPHACAV
jgi:hypothetical protein